MDSAIDTACKAGHLFELSKNISSCLNKMVRIIGIVGNANEDVRKTKDTLALLQTEIETVRQSLHFNSRLPAGARPTPSPDDAISDLRDEIDEVTSMLSIINIDDIEKMPTIETTTLLSLRQKFDWAFKKDKVDSLVQKLENSKSGIISWITTLTLREIHAGVIGLGHRLSDFEMKKMLKFLCPNTEEQRDFHGDKVRLQEPRTCQWLPKEDEFKEWLEQAPFSFTPRKSIWINGIPGAGKTVLASFAVEEVRKHCHSVGYSYYYCLHSRNQEETVPFLKWTLRQLCFQMKSYVPQHVQKSFKAQHPLSLEDLMRDLSEVSEQYLKEQPPRRVYIIVDAVDESRERTNLVNTLIKIGTSDLFRNVSLLFTSRCEPDIQASMSTVEKHFPQISMSNSNVREDIRRYIKTSMAKHPNWRFWGDDFQKEIEAKVAVESKGMFRYAVCQLDVLKRMRNQQQIRDALRTLPKDLFATYERILTEIPEENKQFARTALALMCSDTKIPSAEILVSACLFKIPFGDIAAYNVLTLGEVCGCLVEISPMNRPKDGAFPPYEEEIHRVKLAHYTVKEFLFAPSTAQGPVAFFALSNETVRNTNLAVVFNGLSRFGLHLFSNVRVTRYEEYCLWKTEEALTSRRAAILRNDELLKMVLEALSSNSQHLVHLRKQPRAIVDVLKRKFPLWHKLVISWEIQPAEPQTKILANLVLVNLPDIAEKYLNDEKLFKGLPRKQQENCWRCDFKMKDRERENLLGFCIHPTRVRFLKLFANHNASFENEAECLYTAMKLFSDNNRFNAEHDTADILKTLVNTGANVDPKPRTAQNIPSKPARKINKEGFAFTPLQLAIWRLEDSWVEVLLEEGYADANATGTINGVIPSAWDDPDPANNDLKELREMGQQKPLTLCDEAEDCAEKRAILKHLQRFGAIKVEPANIGVDEGGDVFMADPNVIDLTRADEDDTLRASPSTNRPTNFDDENTRRINDMTLAQTEDSHYLRR
ncbi:hypothetical protein F5Y16DRAFT_406622 [Xylariaceae sp. FL0255]|nr:hypothetical protein F5Y16DRAFT_406622 [Xylariaceae sp. FL0255]